MSAPMTLEEAVEWQATGRVAFWSNDPERFQSMSEAERSAAFTEWSCKSTDADDLIFAHAKRTVAARSGEGYAEKYLREVVAEGTNPEVTLGDAEHIVAYIDTLTAELAAALELVERLRTEATIHAQEARTQRATVQEIYQVCSGSTGERGDWHGAQPVRDLRADRDRLAAMVERVKELPTCGVEGSENWDGHFDRTVADRHDDETVRVADILAALEAP